MKLKTCCIAISTHNSTPPLRKQASYKLLKRNFHMNYFSIQIDDVYIGYLVLYILNDVFCNTNIFVLDFIRKVGVPVGFV